MARPTLPLWPGTLALLTALALLCLGTPARAQSAQDITQLFSVAQSPPVFDRVNRVYYSYVDLTNTSGATVEGRMRLVVTDSTLPVSDLPAPPDGTTYDGKPFYWLGEGDQTYAPGASSGNRRVNFALQRVRLAYSVRVEMMAEAAALVPPSGGILEVTDVTSPAFGVKVEVPAGAIPEDRVLTIQVAEHFAPLPGGAPFVGQVLELGPSGSVFETPVTVTIPYSETALQAVAGLGAHSLRLATYDEETNQWVPLETTQVDTVNRAVTGVTPHFSYFTVKYDKLYWDSDMVAGTYPPVLFVHGIQSKIYGDAYETFGQALELLEDADVKTFWLAYNTWNPIRESAASLALAVAKIKAMTGWNRVHIVAHSMGGLVARAYMQGLAEIPAFTWILPGPVPDVSYKEDVAKLMTIGTPHRGADSAVLADLVLDLLGEILAGMSGLDSLGDMSGETDFLEVLNSSAMPSGSAVSVLFGSGIPVVAGGVPLGYGDGVVTHENAEFPDGLPRSSLKAHSVLELPLYHHYQGDNRVAGVDGLEHPAYVEMVDFAMDQDSDGVPDAADECGNTDIIERVDEYGCPFEQQVPRLLAPADQALAVDPTFVNFAWEPLTSRFLPITYCIAILEMNASAHDVTCGMEEPAFQTNLVAGGEYSWLVWGEDAAGRQSEFSQEWIFSTHGGSNDDYTDPLTGMQFVYVPPGTFQMGDTFGDGSSRERPVHTVTLTQGYSIGKTEVTQAQWQAVMGSNPSYFQPSNGYPACLECPVESVSWDDIQGFVAELNAQTGQNYRLPTEAEWEYAARGGPYSQGYRYSGSDDVDEVGWRYYNGYVVNGYGTYPVGQKLPNELGLYDMSGNVWEWVQDWWGYYSVGAQIDPAGPGDRSGRGEGATRPGR